MQFSIPKNVRMENKRGLCPRWSVRTLAIGVVNHLLYTYQMAQIDIEDFLFFCQIHGAEDILCLWFPDTGTYFIQVQQHVQVYKVSLISCPTPSYWRGYAVFRYIRYS